MAALKMYRQEIRLLSKKEVSDRGRELLKDLNGNAFFFVEALAQRIDLSWRYSSSVMAVRRYCLQSGYCWRNIGPNQHKKRKKEPDK